MGRKPLDKPSVRQVHRLQVYIPVPVYRKILKAYKAGLFKGGSMSSEFVRLMDKQCSRWEKAGKI